MATVEFPEVKDRNVATPSRVRLTKAVGIEDDEVFDVEPVPGSIYEEGTPLNKKFFDALKNYIDNNVGSPDNPIPVTNGGTGASTAEGARTNLGVYSKTEIDEQLERTSKLIEPHIASRVTDTPEGIHGLYIDADGRQWIDPDGDGQLQSNYPVDNETIEFTEKQTGEGKTFSIVNGSIRNEKIVDGFELIPSNGSDGQILKHNGAEPVWEYSGGELLWSGSLAYTSTSVTVPKSSSYNVFLMKISGTKDPTYFSVGLVLTRINDYISGVASPTYIYNPSSDRYGNNLIRVNRGATYYSGIKPSGDVFNAFTSQNDSSEVHRMFYALDTVNEPYSYARVTEIWGLA